MLKHLRSIVLILVLLNIHINITILAKNFEINKSYLHSNSASTKVGRLILNIEPQYKQINSFIQPYQSNLISQIDFQQSSTVILSFVPQNEKQQTYYTSVTKDTYKKSTIQANTNTDASKKSNLPVYSEKILVYTDNKDMQIKAINYVQDLNYQRDRIDGSSNAQSQVVKMEKGRQEIFKVVAQQAAQQIKQQESFFSKYKWPIIIVGMLVYLSIASENKAAPGQGQASGNAR